MAVVRSLTLRIAAALLGLWAAATPGGAQENTPTPEKSAKVVVIPVRDEISDPVLYILRRGIKEAIEQKADTVVLDMNTPGGSVATTFEILLALEKFPGKTVTYVNRDATSAGALISAGTNEIWMSPKGTIGSSEPVLATGGDISESMRRKVISYIKARVRAITDGQGYRGDVISAMIDPDIEFKIGEQVIKEKGGLLNLTAREATATYGDPPVSLLAAGTATTIDDLLDQLHGKGNYQVQQFEPSWAEKLAQYLNAVTPLLLAIGMLALFIEFKTPGFGFFGITGIVLLGVVFFGKHVAGLSGYEPFLLLALGLALIAVEIFFMPGSVAPALTGGILVLASLVWAMMDIWPGEPISFSSDALLRPLLDVTLGVVGAIVLFVALLKFLPQGGPWGNMILQTTVAGEPKLRPIHGHEEGHADAASLVGMTGRAVTSLFPSGQVEINSKRYEAKLAIGFADSGTRVRVTGVSEFGLNVEVIP